MDPISAAALILTAAGTVSGVISNDQAQKDYYQGLTTQQNTYYGTADQLEIEAQGYGEDADDALVNFERWAGEGATIDAEGNIIFGQGGYIESLYESRDLEVESLRNTHDVQKSATKRRMTFAGLKLGAGSPLSFMTQMEKNMGSDIERLKDQWMNKEGGIKQAEWKAQDFYEEHEKYKTLETETYDLASTYDEWGDDLNSEIKKAKKKADFELFRPSTWF